MRGSHHQLVLVLVLVAVVFTDAKPIGREHRSGTYMLTPLFPRN